MDESAAELSETDLALIDSLTVLADLLIGIGALRVESVQTIVQPRIQVWKQKGKAKTAAILQMWTTMATDPKLRERREHDLALRAAEPKGRA